MGMAGGEHEDRGGGWTRQARRTRCKSWGEQLSWAEKDAELREVAVDLEA